MLRGFKWDTTVSTKVPITQNRVFLLEGSGPLNPSTCERLYLSPSGSGKSKTWLLITWNGRRSLESCDILEGPPSRQFRCDRDETGTADESSALVGQKGCGTLQGWHLMATNWQVQERYTHSAMVNCRHLRRSVHSLLAYADESALGRKVRVV